MDKYTGKPVFQCRVMDMDSELEGRSRETVVKILADRMPAPPTRQPFELVEFEGLQVTRTWTPAGTRAAGAGDEKPGERSVLTITQVFELAGLMKHSRYRARVLLATFASLRWGKPSRCAARTWTSIVVLSQSAASTSSWPTSWSSARRSHGPGYRTL